MKTEPRAWVLNLDAEHELEAGRRYTPTRHLKALVARESRRLLGNLVAPGDVVLTRGELSGARAAAGLEGVAWSPTPRALALLESAGARQQAAPAFETLRAVNARPFAVSVRAELAEGSFEKCVALTQEEALALLARPSADGWLVRRSFGAAGRGRRRIAAGAPCTEESAWLKASLRRGPLVIEPWVRVTREYTRSGWVQRDGRVVISAPCFQQTTRGGAWVRTEAASRGEVQRRDDAELERAAAAAGEALAGAGYFGPFGIDAFRHRIPGCSSPREVLNPLSEINARFTMDWATGMNGTDLPAGSPGLEAHAAQGG